MSITQCTSCFLVYDTQGKCPRCGYAPGMASHSQVQTVLVPEVSRPLRSDLEPDVEPIGKAMLRWSRSGLIIILVVIGSVLSLDYMADRNDAAQASWRVQSQLGGEVDARRAELRAARTALQELYAELVSTYSEGGLSEGERVNWLLRWRDQLGQVPVAYRLNINVGLGATGGTNGRAEQSLRNAMLYLTSLERAMAAGRDAETIASLEASFRQSLTQAREDLD